MSETDKKNSLEETPKLAQMRAFSETAFPMWLKRMPGEKVVNLVGDLSIRWTVAGHNVPTATGAIHAELGVKLEVDQILDLVAAWEEINSVKYDPALGKLVKVSVKAEHSHHSKFSSKGKSVRKGRK